MESLPCNGCRGLCCGPVPITRQELKNIRNKVKSMAPKIREELKNQHRFYGTCIFYDLNNDKCGIHSSKPSICGAFGHYRNLICFRNPRAAQFKNWVVKEDPVGLLTIDYTWKDFE